MTNVYCMLTLFGTFIAFLINDRPFERKKAAVRCGALVSECAPIAIVIAPRATVVISDNSSDPARRIGHVETALERRVICCRRSWRIEPIAPCRGRAIIFARRVLWENAHPRLLFYGEVRGLVPNRPCPRRLSLRDTRVSARDRFSRYALQKYSNFSPNMKFIVVLCRAKISRWEYVCIFYRTRKQYCYLNDDEESGERENVYYSPR